MKRTKIVCTIGPASQEAATLTKMLAAGMNVARLNFSHGTHRGHAKLIKTLRRVAAQADAPLALLGDLQGPKIRLGDLPKEGVLLKKGETVRFSTGAAKYRAGGPLPVTYQKLHRDVKRGHRFLIDDGLLELTITKVAGRTILAKVVNGGLVTSHKGMNFPDSTLKVSPITEKDRADAIFGVHQGVDWLALSFVTSAKDIRSLRQIIKQTGRRGQILPRIIVKIEKHEAIDNFDEILQAVDGVMIARGDLGVEIPAEEVPVRQREIIEKCRLAGKPVVVATQMLDSMIRNPRATRAEVSDVAHAVFDHTDAVMLSGESATGKYPVDAVRLMGKIVKEAEASPFDDVPLGDGRGATHAQSVAVALKVLVMGGHLSGVIAFHKNAPWAETALIMHPEIPLFLVDANADKLRANNIRWGVLPIVFRGAVRRLTEDLKKKKLITGQGKLAVIGEAGKGFGFRLIDL